MGDSRRFEDEYVREGESRMTCEDGRLEDADDDCNDDEVGRENRVAILGPRSGRLG